MTDMVLNNPPEAVESMQNAAFMRRGADPDEMVNLALDPQHHDLSVEMDVLLKGRIDYPNVTMDVARYNQAMARFWVSA